MNIPVRVELFGAAIAVATGLMLGGALHPDLSADDRPAGPQIITGWAGARSTGGQESGATLASYGGRAPDYVIGTDARKAMTWTPERTSASPPHPRAEQAQASQDDLPALSRAAYEADPQPARTHDYPSLGGGVRYEDAAPTIIG